MCHASPRRRKEELPGQGGVYLQGSVLYGTNVIHIAHNFFVSLASIQLV